MATTARSWKIRNDTATRPVGVVVVRRSDSILSTMAVELSDTSSPVKTAVCHSTSATRSAPVTSTALSPTWMAPPPRISTASWRIRSRLNSIPIVNRSRDDPDVGRLVDQLQIVDEGEPVRADDGSGDEETDDRNGADAGRQIGDDRSRDDEDGELLEQRRGGGGDDHGPLRIWSRSSDPVRRGGGFGRVVSRTGRNRGTRSGGGCHPRGRGRRRSRRPRGRT